MSGEPEFEVTAPEAILPESIWEAPLRRNEASQGILGV